MYTFKDTNLNMILYIDSRPLNFNQVYAYAIIIYNRK